ncbi:hypothetical protein FACS18949_02460 [Clostridia bacterium]|nr:hypothetical protein FACS18949_02460 [Clostridia bacterium]
MLKELTVKAEMERLDEVLDFVNAALEDCGCPVKVQMSTAVAVEEIFVNKVQYSSEAALTLRVEPEGSNGAAVSFSDGEEPYNPLQQAEGERGLGISLVKSSVRQVTYSNENGLNILKLSQQW